MMHRVSTTHTMSYVITHSYLSLPSFLPPSLMDDNIIFKFEDFLMALGTAPTTVPVPLCPLKRSSKALQTHVAPADCMQAGQHVLTAVATAATAGTVVGT
jgi:hypothetical protein